ncbi:MAG: hypothetical protein ABII25_04245, partial [bacterium]
FFSVARASLEAMGEKDFSKHLMLVKERGMNIFMLKKDRFTQEEVSRIKTICGEKNFNLDFYPGLEGDGDIFDFIKEKNVGRFYHKYPLDIAPSTDDRPFFSTFLKPKDFWLGNWPKEKRDFPLRVVFTLRKFLFVFLLINILLISMFIFKRKNIAVPLYFSFLGIAYMLVEITLIRKFIYFLGHPVYAVSVILFSLLLFNAIGSLTSKKAGVFFKKRIIIFFLLFILVPLYGYPLDKFFVEFMPLCAAVKIILTMILLFPLGYLMGIPFPMGISLLPEKESKNISYVWAINGASSVFGSLLALVLSMSLGYNLTFLFAGTIYILAGFFAGKIKI